MGSKFFPFRVDPFQKELDVNWNQQEVVKVIFLLQNGQNSTMSILYP